MTGYVRKFEGNITMSFKIRDKQFFKKYNQVWKRVVYGEANLFMVIMINT